MLETQELIIIALTKGSGTCNFVSEDSEVPRGCGSEVVTPEITIHIPVQVSYSAFSRSSYILADGCE
jgi:valyl-tRNA synthetase